MGVEPPKYGRMDIFHLDHLRSICARAKNPTDLVEGKSLDEHAHYTRHRLYQKGKHLWDQIQVSYCYPECLCHIYDFTCCSNIDRKNLPFQCEFNENKIPSSYAKGVYDYFDVEKSEEFVAFKGAYEIASLIEKFTILFTSLKTLQFLLIALRIIFAGIILKILKTKCLLPKKRPMIAMLRNP